MSDFSLNELIESSWESGPDPDDIAAKVEPQIPDSELRGVVRMLLTRYIANSKPRLAQVINGRWSDEPDPQPARQQPKAPARQQRSSKVAAIREHGRFLRLSVSVAQREWKRMEDCTYDDLLYAAQLRRHKASQTVSAAEQYEELAELLQVHNADTVGDLPKSVLDEFLRGRKAAA
jgi:hypothetical protein